MTDKSVKALAKAVTRYDPAAAKKTLTDAGFTYKGSELLDPKGNAVKLDIHVISGWSDWVASNQIITKNLQAIGIDSNVRLEAVVGRLVPERLRDEEPDAALAGRVARLGVRLLLLEPLQERVHPVGPGRDADRQLGALLERQGDDPAQPVEGHARRCKQHKIATQLEKIFLQQLPIIPVMIGARWSTYSTKYFHCFPTQKNFYADPIFTTYPDNILLFTTICPGGKAGR